MGWDPHLAKEAIWDRSGKREVEEQMWRILLFFSISCDDLMSIFATIFYFDGSGGSCYGVEHPNVVWHWTNSSNTNWLWTAPLPTRGALSPTFLWENIGLDLLPLKLMGGGKKKKNTKPPVPVLRTLRTFLLLWWGSAAVTRAFTSSSPTSR